MPPLPDFDEVTTGDKAALARALAIVEADPDGAATLALLDRAWRTPRAHVLGLTGPPGVGKSTLLNALIPAYRQAGQSVGVIAVDPSSRRSGGALLGDRIRLVTDPDDAGIFIRSMAARDRLGGLAAITAEAAILMRAVFDVVVVETVGVGQSETEIVGVADTVIFCVQPGAGDALQFMKAGIAEIPDIVCVTKGDLGAAAERARTDVEGALGLAVNRDGWRAPVLVISALDGAGLDGLRAAIAAHWQYLGEDDRLAAARGEQARIWLTQAIVARFGRAGLESVGELSLAADVSPFARLAEILAEGLGE